MSINNLLDKLASKEKSILSQKIFAPYIKSGSTIVLRIDGVIYKLKTPKFRKDGFGVFKAVNANKARRIREAERYEIDEYLMLLPKIDFVLIAQQERWLAYPADAHAFKQRFGVEPNMVSILMVDGAEVLDTVETRFDGNNFWFDCVKFDDGVERRVAMRETIQSFNYSIPSDLRGIRAEERKAFEFASEFHRIANKPPIEKMLENEFDQVGAKIDRCVERGENVEVQWKDSGRTYTSILNKESLNVVTAGICLSGGDRVFDLKSLVSVCREAERRGGAYHIGNGGMSERSYWDTYGGGNDDYYDEDY